MELTINELDDLHVSNGAYSRNVSWLKPEIEGTNERAFSAQHYNPDDLQPRTNNASLNRIQTNQLQSQSQPVKREPLNYDDILLKLNVQIVNGVMRYADPSKGFTFENAASPQVKPQVKPQAKPKVNASAQPLTAEQDKECRIKQEMDRRRLNQVKTTKMLIPNNNATIFKSSVKAPSVNTPTANAPVTKGSGMFKMKMGK
jgi:hypothetical protein